MPSMKLSEVNINSYVRCEHATCIQVEENDVAVMKSLIWNSHLSLTVILC
jgi:hypothetical protein